MNPYNQQTPYYNYQQQTPGPPQPQWQAPPRQSWGDPRPASDAQQQANGQNIPSPISPYNPNSFGHISGQVPPPPPPQVPSHSHTSSYSQRPHTPLHQHPNASWGVRYNQNQGQSHTPAQQYLEDRPALPPRPTSAADFGWQDSYTQSHPQVPPVPPPRPPEYASQGQTHGQGRLQQVVPPQEQFFPHEYYSHRPASHHYDPSPHQWHGGTQSNIQHGPPPPPSSAPAWHQTSQAILGPGSPQRTPDHRFSVDEHSNHAQGPQMNNAATHPPVRRPQSISTTPAPPLQNPHQPTNSTASATLQGQPSEWEYYNVHNDDGHDQQHAQPSHDQEHAHSYAPTPEAANATLTDTSTHEVSPPSITPPPQAAVPSQQTPSCQRQSPPPTHQVQESQDLYGRSGVEGRPSVRSDSPRGRTGTIDSVINAWNGPGKGRDHRGHSQSLPVSEDEDDVRVPSRVKPAKKQPAVNVVQAQTQTDFPPIVKIEKKTETKIETRDVNPYDDLRDEYKTSLNRYANMLRRESAAQGEGEKMKIIHEFIEREIKLRSVLYGVEPLELVSPQELAGLREAASRPTVAAATVQLPPPPPAPLPSSTSRDLSLEVKEKSSESPKQNATPQAIRRPSTPKHSPSAIVKEDSFVVVNASDADNGNYSPGGRPRVTPRKAAAANQERTKPLAIVTQQQDPVPFQLDRKAGSPGANAPMTLDDYVMPERPSPARNAPIVVGPDELHSYTAASGAQRIPAADAPINFQPARPVYTPFRYNNNQEMTKSVIGADRPADAAYSKLRHDQMTDPARVLSHLPSPAVTVSGPPDRNNSATPSRAKQQQEEAFVGLLRQQSKAIKRRDLPPSRSDAPLPLRVGTPQAVQQAQRTTVSPLVKAHQSLRGALPAVIPDLVSDLNPPPPQIAALGASLRKVSDDFGFIHSTVLAWDKENRLLRQKLDAEHSTRESENQAHIDELFHHNEIGYADIAGLEEDFKLEEASRKYQDDQDELNSFHQKVFDVVVRRLENELDELTGLRTIAFDLMDIRSQSAARRLQSAASGNPKDADKAPLAEIMDISLQIYHKIDVRYTKIAEANFERERRGKVLELSILHTNGDTAGAKGIEKDFEKAQALQMLTEARKRDERANKLVDGFDRAVFRCLAENQDWSDDILNKTTLLQDLVTGAESNGPVGQEREVLLYGDGGIKSTMELVQKATSLVAQDSKTLINMSHFADRILNEADFAMCLADAKMAGTDQVELDKLKNEKTKEDEKLKEEFQRKIGGIARGPDEIHGYVNAIKDFVGEDKDHRHRVDKALEQAKRRNAGTTD